jgi:hypothetical protein
MDSREQFLDDSTWKEVLEGTTRQRRLDRGLVELVDLGDGRHQCIVHPSFGDGVPVYRNAYRSAFEAKEDAWSFYSDEVARLPQ